MLTFRWRREVIQPQRQSKAPSNSSQNSSAVLPPIRMQVLIYPGLQFVNSTTASYTTRAVWSDPLQGRAPYCRALTWLAFPERINDRSLVRTLCMNNHTTRATRERLAHYFHFGPLDGSEDEVRFYQFVDKVSNLN